MFFQVLYPPLRYLLFGQKIFLFQLSEYTKAMNHRSVLKAVIRKGETTVERLQTGTKPGEVENCVLP